MRILPTLLASSLLLSVHAQYGTFDANAVKAAKGQALVVVLDAGDSPYNRTITDAVKAHWKFNSEMDFITVNDLATQPLSPDRVYLLKTMRNDPQKFTGTFLTLAQGWKQKKGEALEVNDNAVVNLPNSQDLAYIQIDPIVMAESNTVGFIHAYVKHLQDYLKQVSSGKITDRATADRLYQSRQRLMRDNSELWIGQEHLDKSLPDAAAVKAHYTKATQVSQVAELAGMAAEGRSGVAITDVVLTGDHKTKHCFKRVFSASTGELMYVRDDAAVFGKKEGFLEEDLKTIERAR